MGKGSNIRPRKVSQKQYEDNWDKIFSKPVKKADSKRDKSERAKQ